MIFQRISSFIYTLKRKKIKIFSEFDLSLTPVSIYFGTASSDFRSRMLEREKMSYLRGRIETYGYHFRGKYGALLLLID